MSGRRDRITRRTVLGAGASSVVTPAAARSLMHVEGGQTPIAQQSIIGLTLSNSTFLARAGSASRFVGNASAHLSPANPAFNGTYGLAGPDAGSFHIDRVSGALSVGSVDVGPGSFNVSIIPTGAYIGSGQQFQKTLTGTSPGVPTLTTNDSGTRPLGAIFLGGYADPRGTNDYPFANIIASVTNGPANPGDYLQFWSLRTGYVGSRWYLNDSPNPGSGISTAVNLHVPSVSGFIWNPNNTFPPTPPVTSWELRFVSGGPSPAAGTVLARQAINIDILKRSNPFFPSISQIGIGSSAYYLVCNLGNASPPNIIAQTMLTGNFLDVNSIKIRYTIDDVPVGPIATGPANIFSRFDLTIDTSNVFGTGPLTDGTHALGVILIDCTSSTGPLPYYFRPVYAQFMVNNSGRTWAQIYAGPIRLPSIEPGTAPQYRLNSGKLDFLTFPGFAGPSGVVATGGTHNTVVPIPLPQSGFIPPFSDPSSPYHGLPASRQRLPWNFFIEGLGAASPTEYLVSPRFFRTVDGAVYIQGYNGETGQTLEGDYITAIRHCNFDGPRNDNQTDQISQAIDGHDGTYWVVFELFGRIIKITHDGTVTTLAGQTTDRTKLGFAFNDSSATEDQLNAIMIQVGRIVSPTFGINDGCWDLRPAFGPLGNTLLVANPVDHYIAQITGLINGPVTMKRIAGQDLGLGGVQIWPADNGGLVDGPATEFVAGASQATFLGSVSGNVLIVISGYLVTGGSGLQPGCPLSWRGAGNSSTTTGHMVISNRAGSGNGSTWNVNFASSGGNQSMTASQPVALFAGPYSVKMADGVHGPDPLGTMYVADYQNSAIRKISADGTTVTTLVGNQLGAMRWDSSRGQGPANPNASLFWGGSSFAPVTISAAQWANGVLTVQTASPVRATQVDPSAGTIAPYWTITLAGLGNAGSGGPGAVAGNFQVLAVTDAQNFALTMPAGAGVIQTLPLSVAGATLTFWYDDVYNYSGPNGRPLNHGQPDEAYCPLPQRIEINSTGKLLVCHTWFDSVSTIDLVTGRITYTAQFGCQQKNTRLNPDRSRGRPDLNFQISWVGFDVDSGVAGDVSSTGCIGPKDDVIILNANGNIIGYYWRTSADGTPVTGAGPGPGNWSSNDMTRTFPLPVGRQGGGHYSWALGISRHQARMLTSGISDSGVNSWRAINPAAGEFYPDPQTNTYCDGAALTRGYLLALQGTIASSGVTAIPAVFPWGTRPGITQTHGEIGRSNMGLPGHADTFDGIQALYPTDDALTTFIQSGFGGAIPAPEFTGEDLKDVIYLIRRMSVQGSIPSGTAGGGFVPISPLVQRLPYESDTTAPQISSVLATRTAPLATTINVTWQTDKPTWGIVAAGFASAHGTTMPYHLFAREAFVAGPNNPSYKTAAHSVTIDVFQDVLTYLIVIAKDVAGNNVISAEQTVNA